MAGRLHLGVAAADGRLEAGGAGLRGADIGHDTDERAMPYAAVGVRQRCLRTVDAEDDEIRACREGHRTAKRVVVLAGLDHPARLPMGRIGDRAAVRFDVDPDLALGFGRQERQNR